MRATLYPLCFVALAALPVAAQAADSNAAELDTASPTYFLGTWNCTGFSVDPQNGEQVPVVGTWKFHPWAGGWLTDDFEAYAGNGTHYAEWGWTHYDHHHKNYSRHCANSVGGYGQYAADGWNDGTWTWTGAVQGLAPYKSPVLQTITQKDDDHFWISVRYFDQADVRRDLYKADCRRQHPRHGTCSTLED